MSRQISAVLTEVEWNMIKQMRRHVEATKGLENPDELNYHVMPTAYLDYNVPIDEYDYLRDTKLLTKMPEQPEFINIRKLLEVRGTLFLKYRCVPQLNDCHVTLNHIVGLESLEYQRSAIESGKMDFKTVFRNP